MNMDKYLEECLDVYESGVVELVKNNLGILKAKKTSVKKNCYLKIIIYI